MRDRFIMSFDNIQGDWFADVPEWIEAGGSMAALQMVCGADDMLDQLAYYEETIKLFLTINPITQGIKLVRDREEWGGHWYKLSVINEPELDGKVLPPEVWLCEVTAFVFNGEFPESLYIRKV